MHHASADKSKRLRRLADYIRSMGRHGATSLDLQQWTGSMAIATDVSELRSNGYVIDCTYEKKTPSGRKVFRYTYKGKKESA